MRVLKNSPLFCLLLSTALWLAAPQAFADGMPYKENKPNTVVLPLDQALDEIQNQEPPVDITPEPAESVTAKPAIEKDEPVVAKAQPPLPVPTARTLEVQPGSSFFGLSVGAYDPYRSRTGGAAFNVEWQPGVKIVGALQPLFGAFATTEGSLMGYAGLGVPLHLSDKIFLMPSFSVGAYKEGDGYDLGRTVAFRIGTELAYQFENKSRIGLNAHVITNGESMDKRDRTGIISLVYTTPFDLFSGKPHK